MYHFTRSLKISTLGRIKQWERSCSWLLTASMLSREERQNNGPVEKVGATKSALALIHQREKSTEVLHKRERNLIKLKGKGGWKDNTTGRAFALHSADLGSIPSIPQGPPSTARGDS